MTKFPVGKGVPFLLLKDHIFCISEVNARWPFLENHASSHQFALNLLTAQTDSG